MKINFYWSGKNWQYINRLTIATHLKVGHEVILWVDGNVNNEYWIDDLTKKNKEYKLEIKNPIKYLNTSKLLKNGWNVRTISTLFQYKLMYDIGEYTADCDAIALKHWPNRKWCLVSESKRLISSVGVLRVPAKHIVLKDAMKKAKKKWGNVTVFSNCCKLHGLKSTYESELFYPVTPHPKEKEPHILKDSWFPHSYSYHVFFKSAMQKNITHRTLNEDKYKNSLLVKLSKWALKDYGYTKEDK